MDVEDRATMAVHLEPEVSTEMASATTPVKKRPYTRSSNGKKNGNPVKISLGTRTSAHLDDGKKLTVSYTCLLDTDQKVTLCQPGIERYLHLFAEIREGLCSGKHFAIVLEVNSDIGSNHLDFTVVTSHKQKVLFIHVKIDMLSAVLTTGGIPVHIDSSQSVSITLNGFYKLHGFLQQNCLKALISNADIPYDIAEYAGPPIKKIKESEKQNNVGTQTEEEILKSNIMNID
jgi:hypothetical protein